MFELNKYKNIYMIGVGGISMSGIAHILVSWGFNVSGSNNEENSVIESLRSNNINVSIGHNYNNINNNIDLVVYTAAIKNDHPELVRAKELGIPTMERADFLGLITKAFDDTIKQVYNYLIL